MFCQHCLLLIAFWLALLLVLVRKGIFQNLFTHDLLSIDLEEARANVDGIVQKLPLITLFADAIKGSLLSSDEEIQSNTLNLIFNMLSLENYSVKLLRILVEENIPDYIFEVLRLSGNKDPVVISCLQVLALFAAAEEVFNQKLRVGFSTLLSVLHYTSQIPLHPVQAQALTLVCDCISNSPGIMSISQVTELASILTCILKRCINGELPETFILTCSTFIEILKSPSANGISKVVCMTKEASRCAVLSSLSSPQGNPTALIMYSLSFLKEAHAYSRRENGNGSSCKELEENIIATCQNCLLPWLERVVNEEVEEDAVHEVLQTFHMILLSGSEIQTQILADKLISSCWFTLCFTYLGLFPTDQMRSSIYLIFASLIDQTLGSNFGQPIRDAFLYLPLDPLDLIFLLGQKSSIDRQLAQCQRASLLLFYVSSLSGERLVDDAQVLASLEQYILLNSNTFYCGTGDSLILTQVVHLYGIFRGSKCSEMSYSSDAEKILLNLLVKEDMEMFSFDMHPVALKWLFQQEKITGYLLNQIMKFCRFSMEKESHLVVYSNGRQKMNMQMIPELVVSGDNYAAPLLVSLLRELRVGGEDDIMCVLKTMEGIVKKYSDASIRYCLCNFAGVIRAIYYSSYCSPQLFRGCSMLVFHVLRNANFHDAVSEEGDWLSVTMKLLEFINTKPASQLWGQEEHLAMSIFCLILHHSRNQVLEDAARAILLDAALASAVENIVQTACAKGPALVDHDEENETGECLTFVLLLYFFSLNSFYSSASQECLDWQGLLQCLKTAPPQLLFSIKCDDLCRLMHFGSPLLKALSSQCLAETLSRISDQRERNRQELRCPTKYLQAMIAIMENLVLYEEEIVATNCGICLSMILSWESLGLRERTVVGNCKWSRFIMEEFAMTLMAPGMASKYFKNQHKPASHIAAALLKLNETPEWMGSVFGASCMSGIISNLCPQKLSAEMVNLFRALLARKYLNESHIGCLNQAFQVCRKQVYKETSTKDKAQEILADKFISDYDDLNKICKLLIQLTVSPIYREKETEHQKLLKEIDLFYLELSAQNK